MGENIIGFWDEDKKDAVLGYKKMLTQNDAEQEEDQSWIQVKRQQIYSTANTSQPQQVSRETEERQTGCRPRKEEEEEGDPPFLLHYSCCLNRGSVSSCLSLALFSFFCS